MKSKKNKKKKNIIIFISIMIILAFGVGLGIYYIYFSSYGLGEKINKNDYPISGIDISAHNGKVDFDKARKDGISFVYLKATEGASFQDSLFEVNYENALKAGIPVGAYHFFRFDMNGSLQAINLLKSLKGKIFDLPIAIDLEEHGNPATVTPTVVKRLQDMIEYLNIRDQKLIIYTNINGYEKFVRPHFSEYMLWICRFSHPVSHINWQFWQYSHWGEVDGVEGEVDLDVFHGDHTNFDNLLGEYSYGN